VNILQKIILVYLLFFLGLISVFRYFSDDYLAILTFVLFLTFLVFLFIYFSVKAILDEAKRISLLISEMAAGNLSKNVNIKKGSVLSQITASLVDLKDRLKSGMMMNVSMNHELAQAKSDFVSLASHQLRTPLSIIKWYTDFVLSGDAGDISAEQKKYLSEIFSTNQRMIDLVNALLDVSRIDLGTFSIEPEPTDIVKKANEAIDKYKNIIKTKEIIFEKKFEKMPLLNLDPRLTLIVLENILSNAFKYTPDKGRVRFTIKKTETNILIIVSDTGVGIPRDLRDKMFTKMFRAADAKKMVAGGNGLGLYVAKAVIEKSGGKIWFESPSLEFFIEESGKKSWKNIWEKGKGTSFFITIPLKGMVKKEGLKKLESIE
jgi:signal transduction histidine kinase